MPADLYAPCPCGSGKKLKWCCQAIYQQLEKIFRLDEEGQHDAAFKMMDELIDKNQGNPEVLGRKAQLLFVNDQVDAAEEALNQALAINPNYAFAFLLRGTFRQQEGEVPGALLLFRKAADLYDPEAREIRAEVFARIAGCELRLNHPVAGRFAYQLSLRLHAVQEMQEEFDNLFGAESTLPEAARSPYTLMGPSEEAASAVQEGKLAQASAIFEKRIAANNDDAAAYFNLGLIRAWQGENAKAIEALDQFVRLEKDESKAAAAWKLAQVLTFAHGLENHADYVQHTLLYQIRDQRFFEFLDKLRAENRLVNVQVSEDRTAMSAVLLEKAGGGLVTGAGLPSGPAKMAAYFLLMSGILRLWNTNQQAIDQLKQEMLAQGAVGLSESRQQIVPASFSDIFTEALVFPVNALSKEAGVAIAKENINKYFEETWARKPLKALGGLTPEDAVQNPLSRKKLRGLIDFLEDCGRQGAGDPYDFNRLREKLGLAQSVAAAPKSAEPIQDKAPIDIASLNSSDLAALKIESLDAGQLDQAFRAAQKVGTPELASQFARGLIGHTDKEAAANHFQAFNHLITQSLSGGKAQEALELVDAGEKADCEHNEGRRRNDFELRRGQVLIKLGDSEQAQGVFERLMDRVPGELRYCGTATEAMLSAKQGKAALRFAERGLAKAREKNDRDSEQYFMELTAAAKKQTN